MQLNPVNYLARSDGEATMLLRDLRVEELMLTARSCPALAHKLMVITEDHQEAVYAVTDPRLIRMIDAVIREF